MKIMHICLANFYIDNYTYQENILPRMHKSLGHEVMILASTETFIDGVNLGYLAPSEYSNNDGIPVHRIPYTKFLPQKIVHKLRIYPDVYKELSEYNPDMVFLHDVQFLSMRQIVRYAKQHPELKIVADGHADFSNSARTFLSRYLLHGLVYRYTAQQINKYAKQFYGTLPARVEFFKNVYHIPANKVEFLPMGVDDDLAERMNDKIILSDLRAKHSIKQNDFLIVTGGKIDLAKTQTLLLMQAVNNIDLPNVKLLIFGSVSDQIRDRFDENCSKKVKYVGWANENEAYQYFLASDLIIFPGRHSVYWEQATGLGKPMVVKYWEGTTHVDLGGNVEFLFQDSEMEITNQIEKIIKNPDIYNRMRGIAEEKGKSFFSYRNIARKVLEDCE